MIFNFERKKLSHNEIAKLCVNFLNSKGINPESKNISGESWDNLVYNFAKNLDNKETSANAILAKFESEIVNKKSEDIGTKAEGLSDIVAELKETSKKIHNLNNLHIFPPVTKDDINSNSKNRIEIAKLIIGTADTVREKMNQLKYKDASQKEVFLSMWNDLSYLSREATEALKENPETSYRLNTLLIKRGSRTGENDHLENIIEKLEKSLN